MNKHIFNFFNCLCALFVALTLSNHAEASELGKVLKHSSRGTTVTITSENGRLLITPYTDNIVKVLSIPDGFDTKIPASEFCVLDKPDCKFDVEDNDFIVKVTFGNIEMRVNKDNSAISYFIKGRKVLAEDGMTDNAGKTKRISFSASPDEAFYGGGERGYAHNLRGDTLVMFNKQNYGYGRGDRTDQMNICIPFYISTTGYGVLFDDFANARLILDKDVVYESSCKTPVAYYFIASEDYSIAKVVDNYTLLTGRQELAPFWSLGYITSKYGYRTQQETMSVIDTLRRHGYPVDGIVLDLYWYGKESDMGRFEWNAEQWPDHRKMLADLKADGVKMIIITQPYLTKDGALDNYEMAKKAGMLATDSTGNVHDLQTWVGEAGMLDVSNPATQQWMWSRYRDLTLEGVTGWWGDLGEPETHPLTMRHYNGLTASEYHNLYGNDWSKIIYDGFVKEFPNCRLMTLMRGGTAGLQRYSVFPWSTDVSRSWGGLQAQVPIMINTALSGLGYMSHDVGGFAIDKANPHDDELYMRWLQLGLFTPVYRTHSTIDAEPYHYTMLGYQDVLKALINARYRMLPYNYTLAYENATTGAPFVRPLNFYSADDANLSDLQDQYMWGRDILVAPVIEKGAIAREVYLPEGTWIDMSDPKMTFEGGQWISYPAPLAKLPLFIKAGSFLVLTDGKFIRSTEEYDPSSYCVRYFHGNGKSDYTLFDDDRTSRLTIEHGEYQLIHFNADETDAELTFTLTAEGNGYEGMPVSRKLTFEIPATSKTPSSISVNGKNLTKTSTNPSAGSYLYLPDSDTLMFSIDWNYDNTTITIKK